jgi:hypothetical protein
MSFSSRDQYKPQRIWLLVTIALGCAACFGPQPPIGPEKIPATYVRREGDAVDSIQLNRDGTMARTMSHGGQKWSQTGRWSSIVKRETDSPDHLHIQFANLEPSCMSDGAQTPASSKVLCIPNGQDYSEMCDRWRSLCFDDWDVRYRHEGPLSSTFLWDFIP